MCCRSGDVIERDFHAAVCFLCLASGRLRLQLRSCRTRGGAEQQTCLMLGLHRCDASGKDFITVSKVALEHVFVQCKIGLQVHSLLCRFRIVGYRVSALNSEAARVCIH